MTGLERLSRILVIFELAVVISASQWSLASKIPFHVTPLRHLLFHHVHPCLPSLLPIPLDPGYMRLYKSANHPFRMRAKTSKNLYSFFSFSLSLSLSVCIILQPFLATLASFSFSFSLCHSVSNSLRKGRCIDATLQPHSEVRTCNICIPIPLFVHRILLAISS